MVRMYDPKTRKILKVKPHEVRLGKASRTLERSMRLLRGLVADNNAGKEGWPAFLSSSAVAA